MAFHSQIRLFAWLSTQRRYVSWRQEGEGESSKTGISFPPWPSYEPDEIAAVTRVLESGKVNYWTGDAGDRRTEDRGQKAEDRGRRAEGKGAREEIRG